MASNKTQPEQAKGQAVQAESQSFAVSLSEFCENLSITDGRTEMIGAFFRDESKAGRENDLATAFHTRFVKFTTTPA